MQRFSIGLKLGATLYIAQRNTSKCECKKSNTTKGLDIAVGNTPLIYIKSLSEATGCKIYGKAEFLNATNSVKDRAALKMIEDAEKSGRLKPGEVKIYHYVS
jgi:threonine dehydratase